jgi:hypothetical protein
MILWQPQGREDRFYPVLKSTFTQTSKTSPRPAASQNAPPAAIMVGIVVVDGYGHIRIPPAPHRISPASRGRVRLISGTQMMSRSPANSASMYGT